MKVLKFRYLGKQMAMRSAELSKDEDFRESSALWGQDNEIATGSQAITILQSEKSGKIIVGLLTYLTEPIAYDKNSITDTITELEDSAIDIKDSIKDTNDENTIIMLQNAVENLNNAKNILAALNRKI